MCGICGVIPFQGAEINVDLIKSEVKTLLRMNQLRGEDATGVFRGGSNPAILKANMPAEKFVQLKAFNDFFTECCPYIGHTRKATKGTPKNNINNHPLTIGDFVVTHNGSVRNYLDKNAKVEAEVDSIWFPWTFNSNNPKARRDFAKILGKVQGSYALSIYNLKNNTTYLVKDEQKERNLYYSIGENYLRYTQIPDIMTERLQPYTMLVIKNKVMKWQLNCKAPFWLIESIEALDVKNMTSTEAKKQILEIIEFGDHQDEVDNYDRYPIDTSGPFFGF